MNQGDMVEYGARRVIVTIIAVVCTLLELLDTTIVNVALNGMQAFFHSKGLSPDIALRSSYKMLDLTVSRQATILSYMDVFLYLGIIFLACVPFVLMAKRSRNTFK